MAIDPVSIENSPTVQLPTVQTGPSQAAPKNPLPLQTSQDAGKVTPAPSDQVLLTGSHDAKYQELQKKNEINNSTAGSIRKTDRSLESLGQNIDALKAPLEAIIKNFPPFAPEDLARKEFLMKYSSLRKQIDDMTFPLSPEALKAHRAEALPAPLPMDVNDSQIADHVAKLDASGAALNDRRAGLAAETATLLPEGRFSQIFSRSNAAQTGLSEVSLTESGAAQKSAEVGRQFATVVSQGVTVNGSQFLKGLS